MGYPIVYGEQATPGRVFGRPDPQTAALQIASRAPVMWADSGRASVAIASATASTGTHPLRSLSGIAARFAGVSMVLGSTAFTVTPCSLVSWASACASAIA